MHTTRGEDMVDLREFEIKHVFADTVDARKVGVGCDGCGTELVKERLVWRVYTAKEPKLKFSRVVISSRHPGTYYNLLCPSCAREHRLIW